jgi:hypothetical protein
LTLLRGTTGLACSREIPTRMIRRLRSAVQPAEKLSDVTALDDLRSAERAFLDTGDEHKLDRAAAMMTSRLVMSRL